MLRVVEDLCTRMSYYASTQEVIDANLLFIAWSTDSVSCYLENKPAGLLRDEQKARNWKATVGMVVELTPVVKQITLVMPLVLSTPEWLMRQVSPALNRVLVMHKVCPICPPSEPYQAQIRFQIYLIEIDHNVPMNHVQGRIAVAEAMTPPRTKPLCK